MFLKPSMYFSISKNSKHKEEAAKFIGFWVNDIEANKLIKGDRGVPVNSQVNEALKPTLDPALIKVFDYVAWAQENSSPMDPPDPIGAAEIIALFKEITEAMDFGKLSPEDAAKRSAKKRTPSWPATSDAHAVRSSGTKSTDRVRVHQPVPARLSDLHRISDRSIAVPVVHGL